MSKVKLGATPKTFKKVVSFPMLDGTTGRIEVSYKYRTRTAFGAFIDKLTTAANVAANASAKPDAEGAEPKFSMADFMEKTAGSNAEYILDVVDAWDLDEPLSKATAQQLADELPGAALAIMETYRNAITEGRLGN